MAATNSSSTISSPYTSCSLHCSHNEPLTNLRSPLQLYILFPMPGEIFPHFYFCLPFRPHLKGLLLPRKSPYPPSPNLLKSVKDAAVSAYTYPSRLFIILQLLEYTGYLNVSPHMIFLLERTLSSCIQHVRASTVHYHKQVIDTFCLFWIKEWISTLHLLRELTGKSLNSLDLNSFTVYNISQGWYMRPIL